MTYYIRKHLIFFRINACIILRLRFIVHTNHEYASLFPRRYITNTGGKTLVLVHLERDQDATSRSHEQWIKSIEKN